MCCLILNSLLLLNGVKLVTTLRNQENLCTQNVRFTMIQKTIKAANRSNCWVCTHFPENSDKGIAIFRVPIPFKTSWNNLWINPKFTTENEMNLQVLAIWDTKLSEAKCVTTNKTKMLGKNPVGHYLYCDWTTQLQKSKMMNGYWNVPKGKCWYWQCGGTARKALPPD